MESEMSAGRNVDIFSDSLAGYDQGSRRVLVNEALNEAEERGYQRGKSGLVVLRSQSQHGFLSSRTDEETGIQTDRCVCGAEFCCDMFEVNEALNDHVRQAWVGQSVPCEGEDLKGLEGRALRERLRSRASVFKAVARMLRNRLDILRQNDLQDMGIIIEILDTKEKACDVEAARLWDQHLSELTTWYIEEDPSYVVLLEKAGNPQYAHIIVERAAARRAREDTNHVPTIQEVS